MTKRAFISYSWTSEEHSSWVLKLATELVQSGVDIVLDKWDLKEGHDAISFMEKMVTDASIDRVIMVFDKQYVEKAETKQGGAGTEAQIIGPKLYKQVDQSKFVGIIAELTEDGKPFLPTFYQSRIYIDLSSDEIYAINFEQLLRWIFDKPLHVKPPLGPAPNFLEGSTTQTVTLIKSISAVQGINSNPSRAAPQINEYLNSLVNQLGTLNVDRTKLSGKPFDDAVIDAVSKSLHFKNEYVRVIGHAIANYNPEYVELIHSFFEKATAFAYRPHNVVQWNEEDWDSLRFIVYELFLCSISILTRNKKFSDVNKLLRQRYYVNSPDLMHNGGMSTYTIFDGRIRSLMARNDRLASRRTSPTGDLIKERSDRSEIEFREMMQSDLILYLYSAFNHQNEYVSWWPTTLVYAYNTYSPFELFARAEAVETAEKVSKMLQLESPSDFPVKVSQIINNRHKLPRWNYADLDLNTLCNIKRWNTIQ